MIALAITALVAITALATALTLVDSWLRARHSLKTIRRERALLTAGFVPEVDHHETRLRRTAPCRAQRVALRPVLMPLRRPQRALRLHGAA